MTVASAALLVVGGLAYGGDGVAPARGSSTRAVARASEVEPGPWLRNADASLVRLAGARTSDDLVPARLPRGWRQVARGVYSTSPRPGEGALVVVTVADTLDGADGSTMSGLARRQRRAWEPVSAVRTTVEPAAVFGGAPGVVMSQRLREAVPNASSRTRFDRVETRIGAVHRHGFVVIGVDDASDPGSFDALVELLGSLRPR